MSEFEQLKNNCLQVALKVVPHRTKVMEILGGPDANTEIQRFCAEFVPLLEANHKLLVSSLFCYL